MNKRLLSLAFASVALLCSTSASASGVVMSVLPGESISGGSIGFEAGPMELFTGLDASFFSLSGSLDAEETSVSAGINGLVVAPTLGLKAKLSGNEYVVPYLKASASYLMPSVKVSAKVDSEDADNDGLDAELDEINESIKESLGKTRIFAWRTAFGLESPLTDNIVLSTECGLKGIYSTSKDVYDIDGLSSATSDDLTARIKSVFAGSYATIGISIMF